MNRDETCIVLVLLGLVVLAWAATPLLGSRHASAQDLSSAALQFDAAQALARTAEFVTKNPRRVAGSLEARQSGGYIQRQLAALGYIISYSHFDAVVAGRKEVGRNVIGYKPGSDQRVIAVVAHYDTARTTLQGAMDNGSGVGVMLELARIFASARTAHSLAFIGSDAGEYGALGADDLARSYPERDRIIAVLSLDYVAIGDLASLGLRTSGHDGGYTPSWLRDLSRRAIRAQGMPVLEPSGFLEHLDRALLLLTGDHGPFLNAGIAAISLGSRSRDPGRERAVCHSDADLTGNLKPESFDRYGSAAERILRTIDAMPATPGGSMESFRVKESSYLSGGAMRFLHVVTFLPLAAVLAFYVRAYAPQLTGAGLRREFVSFVGALLPFGAAYYTITLCRGFRLLPRSGWYPTKDPLLDQPHLGVLLALLIVVIAAAVAAFFGARYLNRSTPAAGFHGSKLFLLGLLLGVCVLALLHNSYWAVTFLSVPATVWALAGPADGPGGRAANRIWIVAAGAVFYMLAVHYAARLDLGWKLVWWGAIALSSGAFSVSAFLLAAAASALGIRFIAIQSRWIGDVPRHSGSEHEA